MRSVLFVVLSLLAGSFAAAAAEPCPGNPDALGTSRVLTISPSDFSRIGRMQYAQTLPLNDHEVVITFDDGPIPPYSNVILDTLAAQCVKVTYFLVGEMAHAYPSIVRRIYNAGHTIGTHSQNHPYAFQRLTLPSVERQVDGGIASVDAALGDPKALSPFFRIPGLGRTNAIENYLASKSLVTWSADVVADDWKHIGAKEIVKRAMRRLEEKGHGILLLHDIHPATVLALPILLKELKDRDYHVVQVVAAGEHPGSLPELMASPDTGKESWPRIVQTKTAHEAPAKPALRHHVKKVITGKHRRPTVANLHEPDYGAYTTDWRQGQF
ncbi:MAG TPA: polysaccharide deacetylase family protein [Pseudolabrys sp.]|jgi:peptidoglycan/xylan/chitin deacetylase (PgdA/CDA1 family)|nr:polysaccharide deacetylase family protein [Pseudolabrys sp.]